MSEQASDKQPATSSNASAARQAQDFLNEGVVRDQGWGPIVDEDGYPLRDDAAYHRQMVEEATDRLPKGDRIEVEKRSQDPPSQKPPEGGGTYMTPVQQLEHAEFWAKHHYRANQAGYVALAVKDANDAGVDVKLGGHNFPAAKPTKFTKP